MIDGRTARYTFCTAKILAKVFKPDSGLNALATKKRVKQGER